MLARLDNDEDPLELSIEKWEDVKKYGSKAELGDTNCALCKEYLYLGGIGSLKNCKGCPVFERTGQIHCYGTPYKEYAVAKDPDRHTPRSILKEIAQREVEFLKSLRKK